MGLRADWLTKVITLPYLPALGPVHPDVLTPQVFQDVLDTAITGQPLPYDIHRRWWRGSDEKVLSLVAHTRHCTSVATLRRRGGHQLRLYHYSRTPPSPHVVD